MPVLRPGQRLGPYTVGRLLGIGGMAEVYAAKHATLDRDVAVKVLNPLFNTDPTFPLRFLREARAVARLRHPNIITVYDYGEAGEIAYLAMELAPGGTLDVLVRSCRTLEEAVAALAPVGEALQYAHDRGIVHRDIKPINVLVDERGRPLLADFGLARIVSESLDIEVEDEIAGTPQYMAPEQAQRADVDFRADIYALGIVTYEVLAGRLPYDGPTVRDVLEMHLRLPPPSLRAAWPLAPEELDAAIRRATAKRPADRYPRVTDFIEELRRAAGQAPALLLKTAVAAAPPPPSAPAAPTVVGTPANPAAPQPGAATACPACNTGYRPEDRFCRVCGAVREGALGRMTPLTIPIQRPPTGGQLPSRDAPIPPEPVAASAAEASGPPPSAPPDAAPATPAQPRRPRIRRRQQRPTGLVGPRRLLLTVAALLIVGLNGILAWQYLEGRAAAADAPGGALWTFIWDERPWIRGGLTALGLIIAIAAALMMRRAVLVENGLSLAAYQRLRRYHRVMGYTVALTAYSVGVLTCVVNLGWQSGTPVAALHSITGTLVLLVIPVKIATVRWIPGLRRYLPWFGWTIATLFALALISSSGKRVWDHLAGDDTPSYYGAVTRPIPAEPRNLQQIEVTTTGRTLLPKAFIEVKGDSGT